MSEVTYKLAETQPDEPFGDVTAVEIEAHGQVRTFTLAEMFENVAKGEKMLSECSANQKIQSQIMENIEQHNPFILEMTDEKLHACHMYFEAKALRNTYQDKVKELEEYLAAEAKDKAEILKQIPLLEEKLIEATPKVEAEPVVEPTVEPTNV